MEWVQDRKNPLVVVAFENIQKKKGATRIRITPLTLNRTRCRRLIK